MVARFREFWGTLPKLAKVFIYVALSTLLSELVIELRGMDQTLWVRYLAQIFNLAIVLLQEYIPAISNRIRR